MTDSIHGQFVWHELMTTDVDAARTFYTSVVGWGTQAWDDSGSYQMWTSGTQPVGGLTGLPAEVRDAGAPPHWLTHIGARDVDATCAEIRRLGGSVLKEPWDIPSIGRVAVVADPAGAVFCLYRPEGNAPRAGAAPKPGEFSWHELTTTDAAGALGFYGTLFGWRKIQDIDMGPAGVYQIFGMGDTMMGGIYPKPAEVPVSNWLPYAMVASADEAAERARAKGGSILYGPMEVPGGDRVAVGTDPQGAVFAVHSSKPA